jgi:hypothetical protein
MDERYAVDTTEGGSLTAVKLQEKSAESSPMPRELLLQYLETDTAT